MILARQSAKDNLAREDHFSNRKSGTKRKKSFFSEISEKIKAEPEECLMVGNDVDEDILASEKAGMDSFLLTDCIINRSETDFSEYKHGSMRELLNYCRTLPDVK